MQLTGNTVLITGGGSGIGRGLAEAFHKLGNKVIIAGRRKDVLEKVAAANPGIKYEILDVQNTAGLKSFAAEITARSPSLNVLVNMAGVMEMKNLVAAPDPAVIDRTI